MISHYSDPPTADAEAAETTRSNGIGDQADSVRKALWGLKAVVKKIEVREMKFYLLQISNCLKQKKQDLEVSIPSGEP